MSCSCGFEVGVGLRGKVGNALIYQEQDSCGKFCHPRFLLVKYPVCKGMPNEMFFESQYLLLKHLYLIGIGYYFECHFFVESRSLFELLFEEWNLLVAVIYDQFLLSNITHSADILGQFPLKRKGKCQNQAGNASNIEAFSEKLAGG